MTDNNENSDEDQGDDDRPDAETGLGGFLGSIGDIIEALSEIEDKNGSRSETGRINRDSFTIDYDYDVNVGVGGDRNRRGSTDDSRSEPERIIDVDKQENTAENVVDIREYEDEVMVSADLPGVDEDKLDVTIDEADSMLTITAGEEIVERVPIGSQFSVSDVSFSNQVLQIRLRSDEGSNDD